MKIIEEIKNSFKYNNNLSILIYINLAIFVFIMLINSLGFLFGYKELNVLAYFAIPANFTHLLQKPWTLISYMFTHNSFLHILFNLLILFSFGKIFLQFLSQRQLLGVYILGGITGALLYVFSFNIIPIFESTKDLSIAIGASGAVMAIVVAVASLVPNQHVFMAFFGKVKLKYIAIGIVILDLISIPINNAGGHIAHLGGAALGYFFIVYYKKGTDITLWVSRFLYEIKNFFKPIEKTQHSTKYKSNNKDTSKKNTQAEIDKILDKISQSGYSSLSAEEKEKIFKFSNKK